MKSHFIFYVRDQERSTKFYTSVLASEPILNVPGMTEFMLGDHAVLGLMPESGIRRLLGSVIRDPADASGIPRSELYLRVREPGHYYQRAIEAGGKELSKISLRDWGDIAGYVADPDGHVLAFAKGAEG